MELPPTTSSMAAAATSSYSMLHCAHMLSLTIELLLANTGVPIDNPVICSAGPSRAKLSGSWDCSPLALGVS